MYKKIFLALFIIIFTTIYTFSQSCYSPMIDSAISKVTLQTLTLLNRQLSGDTTVMIGGNLDTIKSRHYLQPGNQKAAQLIYERFQSFGLITSYWSFSASGVNVIGKITGSKYPNQYFIMCAHYDDMPTGLIAPGADDNASGTVCIIEAARVMSNLIPDYTVLFIAFDEEERGLYGSKAYADTSFAHGDSIVGVLNLDMIAWDGNADNKVRILTNTNSVPFADVNYSAASIYVPGLVPMKVSSTSGGSDHYSFWQRGYKATCTIEDDFNPYYHTVNDKFSNINQQYFTLCSKASVAAFFVNAFDYKISFVHSALSSVSDTSSRIASVTIKSPHLLGLSGLKAPRLYYKVNTGSFNYINHFYSNLDTFKFLIPGQPQGSAVYYYFAAQDSLSRFVGTSPQGGKGIEPPGTIAPSGLYSYSITTGIAENEQPVKYDLLQNYPNPFNAETIIEFSIPKISGVRLTVYDVLGREVVTLIDDKLPGGSHKVLFNAGSLPSGMYFYSLFTDEVKTGTKKLILLK